MLDYLKKKLGPIAKTAMYHLGFIDRKIEEKLAVIFHQKKAAIIKKFLLLFTENHPGAGTQIITFKLKAEADRVCNFTDRAILRANIKKAKYTFWITAVGSTVMVMLTSGFHTPLNFVTPPLASLFTYVAAIVSITAYYNQRVKGAMNSILQSYEAELAKANNLEDLALAPQVTVDLESGITLTTITIDFIPSTIQIQTSLNNKMIISFANPDQQTEQAEQKHQPVISSTVPTSLSLAAPVQVDTSIHWETWKNTQDATFDDAKHSDNTIQVPANGPVWHY